MASKNADLLYFGGPGTDYQCHSETTGNQHIINLKYSY